MKPRETATDKRVWFFNVLCFPVFFGTELSNLVAAQLHTHAEFLNCPGLEKVKMLNRDGFAANKFH